MRYPIRVDVIEVERRFEASLNRENIISLSKKGHSRCRSSLNGIVVDDSLWVSRKSIAIMRLVHSLVSEVCTGVVAGVLLGCCC